MKHSAIQKLRDIIRDFGLDMDVRLYMRQIKLIVDEFDEKDKELETLRKIAAANVEHEKSKHIYGSTFWQDGGK